MSVPDVPRRNLFITSNALHRHNEIVNNSCESHVEFANQFLCVGTGLSGGEVSFGLQTVCSIEKKRKDTHILKEAK